MSNKFENKNYAAKQGYQDSTEAESYDIKRFSSFRGKIGDALDKHALAGSLAELSHFQSTLSTPMRLLDIPCGTGRMTRFLLENGYHVTGSDISKPMMEIAQTKVEHFGNFGGFSQQDASALDFEDNSFDCVVSIRFMGHIPEDVRINILKEFCRVSQFAIIEYSIKSAIVTFRRRIDHLLKTGASTFPKRWPWHIFEKKQELYKELRQARYRVIKMQAKLPFLSDSYYVLVQRDDNL